MENICIGCGLCCDGSLFGKVNLDATDPVEPLVRSGIRLLVIDGKTQFRQPCAAFGAGCCSAYADRPAKCRSYRCRLLEAYEAGDVELEEARGVVGSATRLRDEVRAGMAPLVGVPEARTFRELCDWLNARQRDAAPPGAGRGPSPALLLAVASLELLLERRFRPVRSPPEAVPGADDSVTEPRP